MNPYDQRPVLQQQQGNGQPYDHQYAQQQYDQQYTQHPVPSQQPPAQQQVVPYPQQQALAQTEYAQPTYNPAPVHQQVQYQQSWPQQPPAQQQYMQQQQGYVQYPYAQASNSYQYGQNSMTHNAVNSTTTTTTITTTTSKQQTMQQQQQQSQQQDMQPPKIVQPKIDNTSLQKPAPPIQPERKPVKKPEKPVDRKQVVKEQNTQIVRQDDRQAIKLVTRQETKEEKTAQLKAKLARRHTHVSDILATQPGNPCPVGYGWYPVRLGYLCGGGNHFVHYDETAALLRGERPYGALFEFVNGPPSVPMRAVTPPMEPRDMPMNHSAEERIMGGSYPLPKDRHGRKWNGFEYA